MATMKKREIAPIMIVLRGEAVIPVGDFVGFDDEGAEHSSLGEEAKRMRSNDSSETSMPFTQL